MINIYRIEVRKNGEKVFGETSTKLSKIKQVEKSFEGKEYTFNHFVSTIDFTELDFKPIANTYL